MQYEISGSVLAGQITTTTWAGAPSRTWAWSRSIGGAGRGIGGAGQFASWTRAAQLAAFARAEAAVARATVPPRRSTLRWNCPGARLGRRHRRSWPARVVDQGGSARDVGLGGGAVRTCWCRYASSGDLRRHSEADGPFSQTIGCAATDRRTRALTVYSLYAKMPAWGKA